MPALARISTGNCDNKISFGDFLLSGLYLHLISNVLRQVTAIPLNDSLQNEIIFRVWILQPKSLRQCTISKSASVQIPFGTRVHIMNSIYKFQPCTVKCCLIHGHYNPNNPNNPNKPATQRSQLSVFDENTTSLPRGVRHRFPKRLFLHVRAVGASMVLRFGVTVGDVC